MLPKAERVKTLFLSPLQLQNAGGGGGGGRVPPGGLQKIVLERFGWLLWGKGPRPLVGRAPSPGGWPTGPWGLNPATLMG